MKQVYRLFNKTTGKLEGKTYNTTGQIRIKLNNMLIKNQKGYNIKTKFEDYEVVVFSIDEIARWPAKMYRDRKTFETLEKVNTWKDIK